MEKSGECMTMDVWWKDCGERGVFEGTGCVDSDGWREKFSVC